MVNTHFGSTIITYRQYNLDLGEEGLVQQAIGLALQILHLLELLGGQVGQREVDVEVSIEKVKTTLDNRNTKLELLLGTVRANVDDRQQNSQRMFRVYAQLDIHQCRLKDWTRSWGVNKVGLAILPKGKQQLTIECNQLLTGSEYDQNNFAGNGRGHALGDIHRQQSDEAALQVLVHIQNQPADQTTHQKQDFVAVLVLLDGGRNLNQIVQNRTRRNERANLHKQNN